MSGAEGKVVLLTEAEWRERLAGVPQIEATIAALDSGGLIGEPVDPLLVEAREFAVEVNQLLADHLNSAGIGRDFHTPADDYVSGRLDGKGLVGVMFAALRRGMELAPAARLTREQELAGRMLPIVRLWAKHGGKERHGYSEWQEAKRIVDALTQQMEGRDG